MEEDRRGDDYYWDRFFVYDIIWMCEIELEEVKYQDPNLEERVYKFLKQTKLNHGENGDPYCACTREKQFSGGKHLLIEGVQEETAEQP